MANEKKPVTTKVKSDPLTKEQMDMQATRANEQALVTKGPAEIGAVAKDEWDLGDVNSLDIAIPKLLIMQAPSKLVAQEKAQMGDMVNSVTAEILGTCREKDFKPVQFISFREEKTWTIFEVVGSKPEFRGTEPLTPQTNNLEQEFEKDGKKFKRFRTLNYFVLLVSELENSDTALPYVLSFRSTGYKTGKAMSNHFLQCKAALQKGKVVPPPATIFELAGVKTSNDKGTFYVPSVKAVGATKKEHVSVAGQWLRTLKTKAYKVDESDVSDAEADESNIRDVKPGEVQDGAQF